MNNLSYHLQTFGCKSNQYESQGIRETLDSAGFREVPEAAGADILVINSCGVTSRAGASCRNAVRKALRANPSLRVVLTGCGVDLGEKWPDIPSGPPLRITNARKHALTAMLRDWLRENPPPESADDRFGLSISSFSGHTRAFLKVQDGCDNHCAYCAVPLARGNPLSRDPAETLAEARRLVESGHREIVLTGINIGVYRHGALEFPDLVAEIASQTPGLVRLRLGSVEPPQMTQRLAAAMAADSRICPHVHLPLQSGDDAILARMGRRYSASEFLEKAAMLRETLPHPAITTDVIVGFPGEDEHAFLASEDVCSRAGLSRLHVFLFSARPGTPAAAMRRTVPEREIEKWKTRLIETGRTLACGYAADCVGMTERVILEKTGERPGGLSDRYVKVLLDGDSSNPGSVCNVKISASEDENLTGTVTD